MYVNNTTLKYNKTMGIYSILQMQDDDPAGIWCENDVVLTSMRRDYVASTLIRRHFDTRCPLGKGICYLHLAVSSITLVIHSDFRFNIKKRKYKINVYKIY